MEYSTAKARDMTDVDFRRLASLLFALNLIGKSVNPIEDAVELAEQLLNKLQNNE